MNGGAISAASSRCPGSVPASDFVDALLDQCGQGGTWADQLQCMAIRILDNDRHGAGVGLQQRGDRIGRGGGRSRHHRLQNMSCVTELASATLTTLLRSHEDVPIGVPAIYPSGVPPAPELRAFIECVAERCSLRRAGTGLVT